MRACTPFKALPVLLAAFALSACQEAGVTPAPTATPAPAPVTETPVSVPTASADCVVTDSDVAALQKQFQTRFQTTAGILLTGEMPKEGFVERLSAPFSGDITTKVRMATAQSPAVALSWTVPVDSGCYLEAKLGTSEASASTSPAMAVKALRLKGEKSAASEIYFPPIAIILHDK